MQVVALSQGAFFFGLCTVALFTSVWQERKDLKENGFKIGVLLGIMCVVGASLLTMFRTPYPKFDVWYIVIVIGYALLDICLVFTYRRHLMERQREKFYKKIKDL